MILLIAGLASMVLILAEKWRLWRYYERYMPRWWWRLAGVESCDVCRLFWMCLLTAAGLNGFTWLTVILALGATPFAFALWVLYVNNSNL